MAKRLNKPSKPIFPKEFYQVFGANALPKPLNPIPRYGLGIPNIKERLALEGIEARKAENAAKKAEKARERKEKLKFEQTSHSEFDKAKRKFLDQHDYAYAEVKIPESALRMMLNYTEQKKGKIRTALAKELKKKKNRSEYIGKVVLTDTEFKSIISSTLAREHNIPFKAANAFAEWYNWARKLPRTK